MGKSTWTGIFRRHWDWYVPHPMPALSLDGMIGTVGMEAPPNRHDDAAFWFAVPKRKVSRSRKRMKTTRQKRIPILENIVEDRRTGELTLRHKLPRNWKEYIPNFEYEPEEAGEEVAMATEEIPEAEIVEKDDQIQEAEIIKEDTKKDNSSWKW